MKLRNLKIINARLILPDRILEEGIILVREGKILAISDKDIESPDALVIDAQGKYVAPGFIDIHVHGGADHDFMDNDLDGYLKIAALHAQHGTTAFTPTTLSCGREALQQTIEIFNEAKKQIHDGAAFLGLHIEGPYFAKNMRGAQPERFIHSPDPAEYEPLLNASSHIVRWSAAPELPGALAFGAALKKQSILPAIAHTDAIYEQVLEALEAGYTHVTHLYSAMSGVSRRNAFRYAGVIEAAFLLDQLTVEIIADGIHLPAPLLKLVYKIKGPESVALITDAMRGAGMPAGESMLGDRENGTKVIIEDRVAKLMDRSAFAGSVATTDLLVRNMVQLAEVPLTDAVKMMTATPARIMGIDDRKGVLEVEKEADIVVFDENINIAMTIIGGRIVYDASIK